MSYLTATLIFISCIVLAVAVCAPFFYLARKLRSGRTGNVQNPSGKKLTAAQALPGLVLVAAMFLAFAHQYIAPEGWLGSRLTTQEGRFWFSVLLFMIASLMAYLWRSCKGRKAKHGPASRDSAHESNKVSDE